MKTYSAPAVTSSDVVRETMVGPTLRQPTEVMGHSSKIAAGFGL